MFVLIAAGIAVIVGVDATAAVLAGSLLLGMGNGMATLARATAIADLYGGGATARSRASPPRARRAPGAAGPVAAAVYAAAVGYGALLWSLAGISAVAAVLAYQAERRAG